MRRYSLLAREFQPPDVGLSVVRNSLNLHKQLSVDA